MHSAIIESIGNKVILAKTSGVQKGIYSKIYKEKTGREFNTLAVLESGW